MLLFSWLEGRGREKERRDEIKSDVLWNVETRVSRTASATLATHLWAVSSVEAASAPKLPYMRDTLYSLHSPIFSLRKENINTTTIFMAGMEGVKEMECL